MSYFFEEITPFSKAEEQQIDLQKEEVFADENNQQKQINLYASNQEQHAETEELKTYLHTLRILKVTNDMLRKENKELHKEINIYKKKIDDLTG